jgi:hypothetical protein
MKMRGTIRPRFAIPLLAMLILLAMTPAGQAEDNEIPDWIGLPVTLKTDVIALSNPNSTQEELPGLGHKFELIGAMVDDEDPENSTNDTISDLMTPTVVALAFRNLPPGVKLTAFDTQLGFKYYFVAPRSCGGGSPRVTLLVDANGDGDFDQATGDFAAHGHPNPFMGCPPNMWVYENLTDNGPRWEVTPGGAVPGIPVFPFSTWDTLEGAVTTLFPDHKVLAGFLVDDSCSFHLPACGEAHYDLVTIENRTLENDQDTVKGK